MPDLVNSGSITLVDGTSGVNPPLGSYLDIGVEDHPAVSLDLEGAFTGTLVIEATAELGPATDWFTPVVLNAAGVAASATLTAAGRRFISAAGLARVRLRCTAFTSGPITATWRAGQGFISAGGGGGGGGAVTVADGADLTQGATTDAAATTDTQSTTIVAFWKRLLSRLTTLLPQTASGLKVDNSAVTQPVSGTVSSAQSGTWTVQPGNTANTTAWKTDSSAVTQPVSAASLPLPTGAAADATLGTTNTQVGGLTETAPATDIASSGLNGRLQRVAQRLSSLIALLPTALVSNRLDVNLGAAPATVTIASPTVIQGAQNAAGAASWNVQGAGGNQAAVAGNPVWMAGSTTAAGGNLQSLMVESAANPNLRISIWGSGNQATVSADGDGARGSGGNGLPVLSDTGAYNGSGWDRVRNNVDVTLLASAARTTTQSGTITTYNLGAIKFILDMTVITAGPSVTLTISETDLASGKTILLLSGAAVVTAVTNEYTVDPMIPAVANVTAQKRVPRTVFWQVTANSANSGTYSLGSMQLPA